MASASDITQVRINTGEASSSSTIDDAYIGGLIDASGVTGATVTIWRNKLASYVGLVDVTEAGASHKASDLFNHAEKMLLEWEAIADGESTDTTGRLKVKKIVRT